MLPFYLYILKCSDGSYYVGHTDDLDHRIAQHQVGEGCQYTAKRLPIELVFAQEFATRSEAVQAEIQIKRWSRVKKEALIKEDWNQLVYLARGRTGYMKKK